MLYGELLYARVEDRMQAKNAFICNILQAGLRISTAIISIMGMFLPPNTFLKNQKYRILYKMAQGTESFSYAAELKSREQSGTESETEDNEPEMRVVIKEFFNEDICTRYHDGTVKPYDWMMRHPSYGDLDRHKSLFLEQATRLLQFEHSGIISVLDVFEENETAYFVTLYHCEGRVGDHVFPYKNYEQEIEWVLQLLDVVDFIHQNRVLHLSINPSNIVLNDHKAVVLIDFWDAKQYDTSGYAPFTGLPIRYRGFSPPELNSESAAQFQPTLDMYAIGATFYYFLTEHVPIDAAGRETEPLPPPSALNPIVPEALDHMVLRAMAMNKKDRFQSALEMKRAILNFKNSA